MQPVLTLWNITESRICTNDKHITEAEKPHLHKGNLWLVLWSILHPLWRIEHTYFHKHLHPVVSNIVVSSGKL